MLYVYRKGGGWSNAPGRHGEEGRGMGVFWVGFAEKPGEGNEAGAVVGAVVGVGV